MWWKPKVTTLMIHLALLNKHEPKLKVLPNNIQATCKFPLTAHHPPYEPHTDHLLPRYRAQSNHTWPHTNHILPFTGWPLYQPFCTNHMPTGWTCSLLPKQQDWHCQCTHAPVWWLIPKTIFKRVVCFCLEWSFWPGGFCNLLSEQVTVLVWCL